MTRKNKAVLMIVSAAVLLSIAFCVSIPVVNDLHAKKVADELSALPLPENTRIAEKLSVAAKLWGNGNGMQYMGALLIESGLPIEELEAFYSEKMDYCSVSRQTGKEITVTDRGKYSFKTDITSDDFYIVYALGSTRGFPMELFAELDLRGR